MLFAPTLGVGGKVLVAGAPGTRAKISLQPEKDLQEIMVEQVFLCSP